MKDLLEKLKQQVPWATFGEVLSQQLDQRMDATREIVDQLKEWGTHLTSNALRKWSVSLIDPHDCQVPHVGADERLSKCTAKGVVLCDCCGRWSCLAHCRVDWQADGLGDPEEGYIAIQAEVPGGGQYRFRNVYLTELE